MNKTYIKRQLILSKLGFNMSKDIQKYVDIFRDIFGDVDDLVKEHGYFHNNEGYMYYKNDGRLFFYNKIKKEIILDSNVWLNFQYNFNHDYEQTSYIFTALLEEFLNIKVNRSISDYIEISINWRICK